MDEKTEKEKAKEIDRRLNALEEKLAQVANWRDPIHRDAQIDSLFTKVYSMNDTLANVNGKLEGLFTGRFLEIFDKAIIKKLWAQSNISLKQIAGVFSVSEPQASRYCNGETEDLYILNRMKRIFEENIKENQKREALQAEKAEKNVNVVAAEKIA